MDFEDSPDEAAYRAQVRAWLEAEAPRSQGPRRTFGEIDESEMEQARVWQARKAEAGYACITWPKEWGGAGGTAIQNLIFAQEEARIGANLTGPFGVGLFLCLPTIMTVGDEATKKRFLGPAMRGEEIWCQLFSEPAGGSDLASARTHAERSGDDWIVNGQKIWTSGAQHSDFGLLLTRTNPDVPKHKGLTMFWVDMKSPGVEVRPINQISGSSGFNEVFFSDVHIADSQRLGPLDEGFKVALVTLMHERASVGGNAQQNSAERLLEMADGMVGADGGPALEDPALRERLADWYTRAEGIRLTGLRTLTALSRGETPGPEGAMGKAVMASLEQDLAWEAMQLQDQSGIMFDPFASGDQGEFQSAVFDSAGLRIAGGTDEILRNIIAERVLGLPGEIRTDKAVAFKDLPTGV